MRTRRNGLRRFLLISSEWAPLEAFDVKALLADEAFMDISAAGLSPRWLLAVVIAVDNLLH